jgi:hypothetical protein
MSQTLGASVQWNDGTQTVNIQTASANNVQPVNTETTQTTENLTNDTAVAFRLKDDLNGWAQPGTPIHFSVTGQAGAQAVLEIPGMADDIPMTETSPGNYDASWTPDAANPISVNEGAAVAKLTLNGMTYYSPEVNNVSVDTEPPSIVVRGPQPDTVISGFMPQIMVKLSDAGSGVDPNKVDLKVNGQDVTSSAKITQQDLVYDLPTNMTPGQYSVSLSVPDKAGNTATKNWSFSITGSSLSSDFVHTGKSSLAEGQGVNFSLKAPPGSQVVVYFGEGRQVPLAETSAGVYTGDYSIRHMDRFAGDMVTASITPPNGQAYTIRAPEAMGISPNLPLSELAPVISSPLASQTVSDPLVVQGTAIPTSTVTVHVSFEQMVGPHETIHGELADMVVGADSAGNWQTRPIHVRNSMLAGSVTFHIRASVMMPDGTESGWTEMRIHQSR